MTSSELRGLCLSLVACFSACGPVETPSASTSTTPVTSSSTVQVVTLKVTDGQGNNPRFSPDNQQIAFLKQDSKTGDSELAIMKADGSSQRVLAQMGNYLTGFAWKADGSEFLATASSPTWVNASTGATRPVSSSRDIGFAAMSPDLSPDEKTLVYGVNGSTLRRVDLTASTPREERLDLDGTAPRFSPDGKTLAYVTKQGMLTLYDVQAKTSKALFDVKNFFATLDWFRDGKALVVATDRGIEKVKLGEPFERQLLTSEKAMDIDLSSDDLQLVYTRNGLADLYLLKGF